MKLKIVLIVCSLFYFIDGFAQSPCVKDSCITVLNNDISTLKRIVRVQIKGNAYSVVGPKSFGFGTSATNITIPLKFDLAKAFHKGYAVVGINGLYGAIDSLGTIVIPLKYKNLSDVNEGFAFYSINGDKVDGVVDLKGKEYHIDPLMGNMPLTSGGAIITSQPSSLGRFVCDDIQLIRFRFSEGLAIINNKVMDTQMKFLFAALSIYQLDQAYNEGVVKINWKSTSGNTLYGFMDKQGKIVVKAIYLSAEDFVNGRSMVMSGNPVKPLRQIIDKKGVVLETIDYKY
ncbi:WG repeat-containing protein [Cytophaga aurantiaca]|uniref:WG repeat-containing protein n=1 Tax=Cytophaga aurantiaca TaxID=29530 RepID=UPI00035E222F|nr:WG repeat-containing protein [Cytophaga aurantiaca]